MLGPIVYDSYNTRIRMITFFEIILIACEVKRIEKQIVYQTYFTSEDFFSIPFKTCQC